MDRMLSPQASFSSACGRHLHAVWQHVSADVSDMLPKTSRPNISQFVVATDAGCKLPDVPGFPHTIGLRANVFADVHVYAYAQSLQNCSPHDARSLQYSAINSFIYWSNFSYSSVFEYRTSKEILSSGKLN